MLLTSKQKDYVKHAHARWNIKTGATGAGKTYLDVIYTIPKRIRERAGKPGLNVLLGNTRGTLQRNVIEPMQELYGTGLVSSIRSDNTATLFGERCYCLGADNKKHVDRLRGASIKYAYGDEITTWNREVFEMLKSRLRTECSIFDGTCNPDAPGHWFKAFIDGDADKYVQSYVIDDNPKLPREQVEQLKREYAGTVYYDRYILGLWALAEGLVYPMFDKAKHIYSAPPWSDEETGEWYLSVDYGTLNPTSMGLWRLYDGVAYRTAEYYYSGRDNKKLLTDEEYYDALVKLAGDREIRFVVVDPSAASFIAAIRKHGRFTVRPAKNNVLEGIRKTATAINAGKIKIHESCKDIVREFESYCWDEKSREDKVVKENDHAMDELRYMVMTVLEQDGQVYDVLM